MRVKKIAVIGAGLMGSGISYVSAASGYDMLMMDIDNEAIGKGMDRLRSYVESGIKRGKLSDSEAEALLGRVKTTTNVDDAVSDVDLVIEAVYENMEVKKDLFKRMDAAASPRTILASNTSSLSISELGKVTGRGEKVIGMHYFSPVPAMKLLEIIIGEQTNEDTISAAIAVGEKQGKTTVKAKDSPGFIVNRIRAKLGRECILTYESGIATLSEIDTALKEQYGVPMGPFELSDFVGLDVSLGTSSTLHGELGDCFKPPETLKRLVEAGTLGRKTGSGFYEYGEDNESVPEEPKGVDPEWLTLRIILPYLREAMIEVEEGIATKEDINKAMILGTNYREGPFDTIERLGLDKIREELKKLHREFGDCYSLPKMLQ
ncbi:MAG: 3-hydroxyacyl-CoA dehydrogenase NAD-binding domain-containing protein [Candidatus Thorarchaeota archaeon]|jgi:3-hydroxyacyl-CoA dehydrogenase